MKYKPSKAWFSYPLLHGIVVLAFWDLLRVCSKRHPKLFEIEACGCLWRHKLVGERFKKHVRKHASEKYENLSKMYPKKVPRKVILLWFFGVWSQRRSRVVPKTPPSPPQGQILSKFAQTRVRGIVFLWCFIRSCPRLNPHAPKRFRGASRCSRTLPEFSSV